MKITVKTVDWNKIRTNMKMIGDVRYLIMNDNTFHMMKSYFNSMLVYNNDLINKTIGNSYATFYGVPIAVCETLEDYEVDII